MSDLVRCGSAQIQLARAGGEGKGLAASKDDIGICKACTRTPQGVSNGRCCAACAQFIKE